MKPVHFTLLLIFLLTACAPAQTFTPTPPATQAPQATPTATATARPTVTPTPTEDSLAGAPEGATGKDKDGNWIRPDTNPDGTPRKDSRGRQVYETWYTFPAGPNGETISGWFENHVKDGTLKGGIPLVDKTAQTSSALPIYFVVKDGIQAKYLQHIPGTGMNPGVSYIGNAYYVLISRYYQKSISQVPSSEMENFGKIWPDNFSITLTDAQGNPHTIYGDTSFTVVLVEPEDIPNPDVKMGKNPSVWSVFSFDDEKHAVTILVANTVPIDQLSDQDFMYTLFNPLGFALISDRLTQEAWQNYPNRPHFGTLGYMALRGENPYIILSDSP